MSDLGLQFSALYESLVPLFSAWALKVVGGLAVFVVGLIVARSVRRGLMGVFRRTELDETLEKFLTSLFYYLILTMAGVAFPGFVHDRTGSYDFAFQCFLGVLLLAGAFLALLRPAPLRPVALPIA